MDSTLLKGLNILERVVASEGPVSVSELARATGLPKSNVHRTLTTLAAAGYVLHDPAERRYGPSLKLTMLGERVGIRSRYREVLVPHLARLALQTAETAAFALLSGSGIVVLANAVPARSLAAILPENQTFDLDDTAFGMALRADAARDPLEGAYGLISDHPQRHTFELAIPLSPDGTPTLGAIGIVGPSSRYDPQRCPDLLAALAAVRRKALAGSAPDPDRTS